MLLRVDRVSAERGSETGVRKQNVREDGAVKVGGDKNIKLLGTVHELHGGVVDAIGGRERNAAR